MGQEHDLIDSALDQVKKRTFAPDMPPAARFERRVVAFILKKFGLNKILEQMYEEHRKEHGVPSVTLQMFRSAFRDFPLYLQAKRVRLARLIPLEYLVDHKKIIKVPIVNGWIDSEDRPTEDILNMTMCRGLVFEWLHSGAKGSLWIMHDDSTMKDSAIQVNCLPKGRLKVPLRFGLQPFERFLENIPWTPSCSQYLDRQ